MRPRLVAPATTVVSPPPPGNVPLKPASSTPASTAESSSKSGTAIVKSAPPKETARITVKPNLPSAPVRAGGNFPVAKARAVAVPVAAAAALRGLRSLRPQLAAKPASVGRQACHDYRQNGHDQNCSRSHESSRSRVASAPPVAAPTNPVPGRRFDDAYHRARRRAGVAHLGNGGCFDR